MSARPVAIGFKPRTDFDESVSVIDRWHDLHPEACAQCRERFRVIVTDGRRVVDRSATVARLLVP